MFFDSFQLTYYLPGDELIDIAAILSTDSLFSGMPSPVYGSIPELLVTVFPNPSTNTFGFRVVGAEQNIVIEIYNLQGMLINRIQQGKLISGSWFAGWDGTSFQGDKQPGGVYFYRIKCDANTLSGKVLLLPGQ